MCDVFELFHVLCSGLLYSGAQLPSTVEFVDAFLGAVFCPV